MLPRLACSKHSGYHSAIVSWPCHMGALWHLLDRQLGFCISAILHRTGAKYWISELQLLGLLGISIRSVGTLPMISSVQYLEPVRYHENIGWRRTTSRVDTTPSGTGRWRGPLDTVLSHQLALTRACWRPAWAWMPARLERVVWLWRPL